MRILGIDPGATVTGYGVVERSGSGVEHRAHGTLRFPRSHAPHQRLAAIFAGVTQWVEDARPDAADYYCIDMPDGVSSATVTLGGLTDSMEVIVLRPDGRVWRSGFGAPDRDAVAVIDEVEPGAHIIDVVIPSGRTSTYTITVESG